MVRPNSAPPDPAIAGMPTAAAWIFRQIATAASTPLLAAVVGPGSTGKSVLLDAVAREYQKTGAVVVRDSSSIKLRLEELDPGEPVLVDDAHRLDAVALATLRTFAEQEAIRLIVAYRPWPRSRELSALGATLARRRSPVILGHLDRAAVAARIAARVNCTPPDPLIDLVHEQSGGLPSLVGLVTQALQDTGRFDPRHPDQFRRPERVNVSPGLAERLRYQLEALDPEIYRLLQAMAVGAPLDAELLAHLLGVEPAALTETVQAALATGLLTEAGELIAFVRNIVLRLMPMLHSRDMQQRLANIQLDRGGSVLAAGRQLLGTGASGSRVAAVLERAGDEALRQSPALAAALFAGTIDAGASSKTLAARHSQALALAGDIDQALRLADQVTSDPAAPDRERGIRVAAAVLAHRGLAARSAELYCSLPADAAGGALLAVPALIGIGELAGAQAVLDAAEASTRSATLLAGAEILMARGMLATVTGTSTSALSQLARAALLLEPAGETVLLPDTPAALAAVVALQSGELTVADSTLRRAVAAKLGGRLAHPRHMLLHGWVAMTHGALDVAHRTLDWSDRQGNPLEPRDEMIAAALAVGLARRESDPAALGSAWRRARSALVRHPIDLYALQPLGELAIAASRLGEQEWVTPHLKEGETLLDSLGNPMLWTVPLHWCELHAAIAAAVPSEALHFSDRSPAQRHAAALTDAASCSPYAAALAEAASSWLQVLSGEIDPEAVQNAARRLHGVGLGWEGSQLAGQAAARTADRRVMTALLNCARALQGNPSGGANHLRASTDELGGTELETTPGHTQTPHPVSAAATASGPVEDRSILSDRELEVGELILAGLTHKQIGERLFISAKTVEHHMARIRQRLGAGNRNELFGRLRSVIANGS